MINHKKVYGEYEVPFTLAKEYDEYKFNVYKGMSVKELREKLIAADSNREILKELSERVIIIQEFGNIDIELSSYGIKENNNLDMAFVVCAKFKDIGWDTQDILEIEFSIDMLDNIENFMYDTLIRYAKEHELEWAKEN